MANRSDSRIVPRRLPTSVRPASGRRSPRSRPHILFFFFSYAGTVKSPARKKEQAAITAIASLAGPRSPRRQGGGKEETRVRIHHPSPPFLRVARLSLSPHDRTNNGYGEISFCRPTSDPPVFLVLRGGYLDRRTKPGRSLERRFPFRVPRTDSCVGLL